MKLKSFSQPTSGNAYDRRTSLRSVAQLEADVHFDGFSFKGKTLNISSSGLRMVVKGRVLKGERVEMRISSSAALKGRVGARVVWASELGPTGFHVVGMAFENPVPEWDWQARAV